MKVIGTAAYQRLTLRIVYPMRTRRWMASRAAAAKHARCLTSRSTVTKPCAVTQILAVCASEAVDCRFKWVQSARPLAAVACATVRES